MIKPKLFCSLINSYSTVAENYPDLAADIDTNRWPQKTQRTQSKVFIKAGSDYIPCVYDVNQSFMAASGGSGGCKLRQSQRFELGYG